jgi:hypothetical protein
MKKRIEEFKKSTLKRLENEELKFPIFTTEEEEYILYAYNNFHDRIKSKYPFEIFKIMIGELMVTKNVSIENAIKILEKK